GVYIMKMVEDGDLTGSEKPLRRRYSVDDLDKTEGVVHLQIL
ncbi:hypothetical protein L195_g043556, partial [Trifolium pratense]